MSDLPSGNYWLPGQAITPWSMPGGLREQMETGSLAAVTSAAWPTASLAIFYPFILEEPERAFQMSTENGATVSGNVDVGIYNEAGTRLVSIGGVAQAGVSTIQLHDIADTALAPGLYYQAVVLDNTTGTFSRNGSVGASTGRIAGLQQMAAAYPLPATATFATFATAGVINMAVHLAATV